MLLKQAIIKLKQMNKVFTVNSRDSWVLKNIEMQIYAKELVMVFGPSGAGKSTLLHIMLGLEHPSTGEVDVLGLNIQERSDDELCDYRKHYIGMIYQQPNWVKALTVVENVAFPLLMQGVSRRQALAKAMDMLKLVGLEGWADYRTSELSSGQQQKAALARAIINDPQIIVADEPTGNLDDHSSSELMKLFRDQVIKGRTVIMVTHNLENLVYADRVVQVLNGKIVGDVEVAGRDLEQIRQSIIVNTSKGQEYQPEQLSSRVLDWMGAKKDVPAKPHAPISLAGKDMIDYRELVRLAVRNMLAKKARTFVTVGGVALGIALVVFLLSVGFGAEKLVISTVASLEELRQLEVVPSPNSSEQLTQASVDNFMKLENVDTVLPLINVAGRISYKRTLIDTVVFAAQTDYLDKSAIRPSVGRVYNSNSFSLPPETPEQRQIRLLAAQTSNAPGSDHLVDATVSFLDLTQAVREVVVNEVVLNSIGLNAGNAIGEKFQLEYVITGDLVDIQEDRVQTTPVEYTIVGVIPDTGDTAVVYVPFANMTAANVKRYSQVKVIARDRAVMPQIRSQIESAGYGTTAVADTVTEIETLFSNLRIFLLGVGLIGLAVAALGMFNTLTVSLLERTREVGLMKAIGMRSREVRNLFLTESVTMGILGGTIGLIGGVAVGKVLSLALSAYAMTKQYPAVDVAYLPLDIALLVLLLAIFIGVITGIFPAERATKISALDVLRYE